MLQMGVLSSAGGDGRSRPPAQHAAHTNTHTLTPRPFPRRAAHARLRPLAFLQSQRLPTAEATLPPPAPLAACACSCSAGRAGVLRQKVTSRCERRDGRTSAAAQVRPQPQPLRRGVVASGPFVRALQTSSATSATPPEARARLTGSAASPPHTAVHEASVIRAIWKEFAAFSGRRVERGAARPRPSSALE